MNWPINKTKQNKIQCWTSDTGPCIVKNAHASKTVPWLIAQSIYSVLKCISNNLHSTEVLRVYKAQMICKFATYRFVNTGAKTKLKCHHLMYVWTLRVDIHLNCILLHLKTHFQTVSFPWDILLVLAVQSCRIGHDMHGKGSMIFWLNIKTSEKTQTDFKKYSFELEKYTVI